MKLFMKVVLTLLVAIGVGFAVGLLRPRTILTRDKIQALGRQVSEVNDSDDAPTQSANSAEPA
ncbi:MAG: hypothetical protein ACJAY5_001452 [Actinomycetes bacterium]